MKTIYKVLLALLVIGLGIYGLLPLNDVSVRMTVHLVNGNGDTPEPQAVTISTGGTTTTTLTSGTPPTVLNLDRNTTYQIRSNGFQHVTIQTASIDRLQELTVTLPQSTSTANTISGLCSSSTSGQINVRSGAASDTVNSGEDYSVMRSTTNGVSQLLFTGEMGRSVELGIGTQPANDRAKIDVAFDDSGPRPFLPRGFLRIWFANWFAG